MSNNLRIVHRRGPNWLRLLLMIPFIATLVVPFYNFTGPRLFFGLPFFYWYQMLWVPLSAVIIYIVYRAESGT